MKEERLIFQSRESYIVKIWQTQSTKFSKT